MRVEQRGSSKRAFAINEDFFSGFAKILEDMRNSVYQSLAGKHAVDEALVRSVGDRTVVAPVLPEPTLDVGTTIGEIDERMRTHRAAYEQYSRSRDFARLVDRIREDFHFQAGFSSSVRYSNGFTFENDNLDQLIDVLKSKSGRVEHLSLRQGRRSFASNISVTFFNGLTSCVYEIHGEKKEVELLNLALVNLLRSSEPDHPWLHSRILGLAGVVLLFWSIFILLKWVASFLPPPYSASQNVVVMILVNLISVILAVVLNSKFENGFPKLQVEFGLHWKRLQARRNLLLFFVTGIILPAIWLQFS